MGLKVGGWVLNAAESFQKVVGANNALVVGKKISWKVAFHGVLVKLRYLPRKLMAFAGDSRIQRWLTL